MKITKKHQQGDLLLIKIQSLPDGEIKILSKSRLVLAHGESGHSHVVEESDAELIQIGERILMRLENANQKGNLTGCKLFSENETQFVCDTPTLGRVAFSKSDAEFSKGTVKIGKFGLLKHEEHFNQAVTEGIWEIGRVMEYDWFSQMARQVMD